MEVARLRKAVKASQARTESLEGQLARLRATGTVLSKALYGRKSEQQEKPRSGRKRGQQRGAAGHGRTQRPVARGTNRRAQSAEGCAGVFLLREALRGERRAFLDRHRDRSQGPHTQDRPSPVAPELRLRIVAPGSVGAPGAAAVPQDALRDQLLGTLPVRALCLLPAPAPRCRVAVRPGAGGLARDAGQHSEALRGAVRAVGRGDPRAPERGGAAPADETTWRVQALREEGRSSRAWLWTSVSNDAVYFHIDPSRSAEAAHKLFAEAMLDTVIVCDRYSAYKRLARLLGGLVTLAWCWSHKGGILSSARPAKWG